MCGITNEAWPSLQGSQGRDSCSETRLTRRFLCPSMCRYNVQIVRHILLPYVFLKKHEKTYWRFAMHYLPSAPQHS